MKRITLTLVFCALAATLAAAATVDVEILGEVEWNQVGSGIFADVMPGDPVQITFQLDSNIFVDSGSYNVRGYLIDEVSFQLAIGPVVIGLVDPYPGGLTPYFVLRDNDPAVDGFFFADVTVDWPGGLDLDEEGGVGDWFTSHFEVGYMGDTLNSLDITAAYGIYDYTGLTNFYFTVNDGPYEPIGLLFTQLEISPTTTAIEATDWSRVKALY